MVGGGRCRPVRAVRALAGSEEERAEPAPGTQPRRLEQAATAWSSASVRKGRTPAAPQAGTAHRAQLNAARTFTKLGPGPKTHEQPRWSLRMHHVRGPL